MLSLITLWAVVGLVFFVIGAPILSWTGAQACMAKTGDRVFVSIWLGIVVLANLLLFASLFVPLTLYVAAFAVAVSLAPPFLRRSRSVIADISLNRKTAWALLATTLALAFFAAFSFGNLEDTGSYHHQMLNWLSEYGSVPGLALIHDRFGFTSSWFALIAPLQTGMLKNRLIGGMNNFIFVLVMLQAVVLLGRVFERRAGIDDWFFLFAFALFCRYFFSDLVYAPTPDLPASLLVLVVTWLIIVISISGHLENNGGARWAGVAVLILASGAISIKLSLAPLLAVAMLYYLFAQGFSLRKIYMATAIAAPFVAILMCVSTITSGCPLYPAPYFCTGLPWSLGGENARDMSSAILEFARWVGPAPPDATSFNWIWHDPPNNNHFNDKPIMAWLLIVNALCGGWLYFKRKQVGRKVLLYVALVALVGIIFILVKAPHLRFGLSFFVVIPALAYVSFLMALSQFTHGYAIHQNKYKVMLLFFAVYFSLDQMIDDYKYIFQVKTPSEMVRRYTGRLLFWPDWPNSTAGLVEAAQVNNIMYMSSAGRAGGLCWGAQIPCVPDKIGSNIWLRDESAGLSKGFIKKPPQYARILTEPPP